MTKANRHAALFLFVLAGPFLFLGGKPQAAPTDSASAATSESASKSADAVKDAKHSSHTAHRSASKTAQTSSSVQNDRKETSGAVDGDKSKPAPHAMVPSVTNAHAQATASDATTAQAMAVRAMDNVQAATDGTPFTPRTDNQIAPDQLNGVDHALRQDDLPAQEAAVTATNAQPPQTPVTVARSSESSIRDRTSLIGKVFVGFGTLLTLASAARMFMA